jgi:hypothetical protein
MGAVVAVAFAGLFRMGELTSSDKDPFDPAFDMQEKDLTFLPTFWTADRIRVRVKRSKADQSGAKDQLRPRFIPVDDDAASAGGWLRTMLAHRHKVREGTDPVLGAAPLFQDGKKGQLKRDAVLTWMRAVLRKAGYSESDVAMIGTHSCRIGGSTALFQLGATASVFQHMGGWCSDAYKAYIRMQQEDLLRYTRRMCVQK